jgi:hypothetical protein
MVYGLGSMVYGRPASDAFPALAARRAPREVRPSTRDPGPSTMANPGEASPERPFPECALERRAYAIPAELAFVTEELRDA